MYYVYAIYNKNCRKYYIGQTQNLKDRLKLHNNHSFNGYTSKFDGLWKLIYREEVPDRKTALIREKQLKSYRGRQFIKNYIPE